MARWARRSLRIPGSTRHEHVPSDEQLRWFDPFVH